MNIGEILKRVDHTLLSPECNQQDVKVVLDDSIELGVASACIPPSWIKWAKEYVGDGLTLCTVIGFPLGYQTTAVKVYEAKCAVEDGADEIDMVINIGKFKDREHEYVVNEINSVKEVIGDRVLKVIVETSLMEKSELVRLCKIVSDSDADYIKTSTGFGKRGASFSDIELFKENVSPRLKIKASGGIGSLQDAEEFIGLGADRLGTSRIVKLVKGLENGKGY